MPIRVTSKRRAAPGANPTAPVPTAGTLPFGLPQPPAGRKQKPPGISLCMIVKNEEQFLAQCLSSVADAVDEIIVVDTGSTDRTVEIAESFGAIVIERPWRNDFAWARNESIAQATKRWILYLDADEELTPESKPALRQIKNAPAWHVAAWIRCLNRSDDYRGTGDMSHSLIRLFPNTPEIRFKGLIHEFVTIGEDVNGLQAVTAPITIIHHGYLTAVVKARDKGRRNLDIVRAATEQEPDDPFHWFNLGTTAFLMGEYEQARDALEAMARINGDRKRGFVPNAYAVLAEIYSDKLGDPVRGEQVAREGLLRSPHYANAHFQLGKALIGQRRFEEARAAYREAIDDGAYAHMQFVIDDQVYIWKALCEIGSTYVLEGDDAKAVEWFERALAKAPNVQPIQVNRARALDRLARHQDAAAAYAGAFETHRDDVTTIDYVNFLLRRGNGLHALEIIESVHAELSDNGAVAVLQAAAQIAIKNELPLAEKYYREIIRRSPDNAQALNQLELIGGPRGEQPQIVAVPVAEAQSSADFLRRSYQAIAGGRFEDAIATAKSGIESFPTDGLLHYNAAIAAANLHRKSDALEHLAFVNADHGEAYPRSELLRAVILREFDRNQEALDALGRLLAVDPRQVDAILARVSLLEAAGRIDEAERDLQTAFTLDRQRTGVELAAFYMRTGRFADAARIADQALMSSQ